MKQALVLTVVLAAVVLAAGTRKSVSHDGRWWLSISAEEQDSYLDGYGDCYVDSLKSKRPPDVDNQSLRQSISASYRSGKSKSAELVPAVMKRVWAANAGKKEPPPPEGGETWPEPHGYFDGLYWKGGSGSEKLGFVEGQIDCFNEEAVSQFRFPDTASDYVKWIDESYGWDPDRAIAHSSEYEKVPNVLLRKGHRLVKK